MFDQYYRLCIPFVCVYTMYTINFTSSSLTVQLQPKLEEKNN